MGISFSLSSFWELLVSRWPELVTELFRHINMTTLALLISLAIGVPLGILITRNQTAAKIVIGIANVMQSIPSIALLSLAVCFLGIGTVPAILMVFVYAFLPILKNTYTGIMSVDPKNLEVARGMGLTRTRCLFLVELPIAAPFIMAGIRIAAVASVGTMTIAAFAGAKGLGWFINLGLNYVLIFGKFGMPKLGVRGAALATLIARVIEFALMVTFVYSNSEHPLAGKPKELFSFDKEMFRRVLKTSLPVIISEGGWSIGNSVYYIAYGMLGASALAVVQVASTINDLFQSVFFGIGNASAVMIGNELGRREEEKAYSYAVVFLKMTFIVNLVMSVSLFLSEGAVISLYDFDAATNSMLANTITVYAIYMLPKMFTYVLFCGILRSGGDTRFCMMLDLMGVWIIGVPLAFLGVLVLKLPLHLVVAMVFFEEWVKLVFASLRFKSKKWAHTLID